MSLLKKLFGKDDANEPAGNGNQAKKVKKSAVVTKKFGRYTDCNKNALQLDFWNKSMDAFKDKRYVDSFEAFLNYAKDERLANVTVDRNGDQVKFELIQGSKRITGKGDAKDFVAEAQIARMPNPNIPVMRKLMGINYGLRYSKFAMNEDVLSMKFSSHAIDASPNKLYAGLRELSKKADQQDDLLLSEFSSLEEVDVDHALPVNKEEQEVKYKYLMKWIEDTRAEISRMDQEKMAGGISFLLLNLTYKIDYLICPQGELTNALERIQSLFFQKNEMSTKDRNVQIITEFDNIQNFSKEKILDGLYEVKCTFGIANAASHKTVMDMMFKERDKVGWYRQNNYPKVVDAVYGYMISYAFFNYGMIYPVTDLLNIAMHIMNADYYHEMGDSNSFINADGSINVLATQNAINAVIANARKEYININLNTAALKFNSAADFVDSLVLEMDRFDLRKK